jgi:hypothetical protein
MGGIFSDVLGKAYCIFVSKMVLFEFLVQKTWAWLPRFIRHKFSGLFNSMLWQSQLEKSPLCDYYFFPPELNS